MELFHCFGADSGQPVDTPLAVGMLRASGCRYLAVNTHTVAEVRRGDDLPVGYSTATLGSVRDAVGPGRLTAVLNINHAQTTEEAVSRARRAAELTGLGTVKLEVLDPSLRVTRNDAVLAAAHELIRDGLEVWPLITAGDDGFAACVEAGSTMVRVMGSPIGARRGIDAANLEPIHALLDGAPVPVMLDGGIGSVRDVVQAGELGFSSVLVNSCLFADGTDPVAALREFRTAVETVGRHTPAGAR